MVDIVNGVGVHLPPSPAWADFTLMMECTPESGHGHSVYSVVPLFDLFLTLLKSTQECTRSRWGAMRRKARGLVQHGGPPDMLEERDPAGFDFLRDGRSIPPALTDYTPFAPV